MMALGALAMTGIASTASAAATLEVPGGYATIQQAIDAASDGDTVAVAAGTYAERIVVARAISVVGAGREETVLSGSGGEAVVLSADGATLSGFTILGQVTAYCAKAIIEKNAIRADGGYSSIYAYTYPYAKEDCHGSADAVIQNNFISGGYFGVSVFLANPVVRNNVIVKNIEAGVISAYFSYPTIVNNTIANNGTAGVMNYAYGSPTVTNNIIAHNGRFGVVNSYNSGFVQPAFNVLYENQVANYASIQGGTPITPSGSEIVGDPALDILQLLTSDFV
jgi:nitrous oxidase accessory protein NosD